MPGIFRASRVNLGFSDTGWLETNDVVPSRNLRGRLRDLEIPVSGGLYFDRLLPRLIAARKSVHAYQQKQIANRVAGHG